MKLLRQHQGHPASVPDPNPTIRERQDEPSYSDADIASILAGGSVDGRRNWLTGAYAKGEIDRGQVDRFWPEVGA